jgi:ribosomal protein S18 acetylase RimI-like enzyme
MQEKMVTSDLAAKLIQVENAPHLPGLRFRHFRGEGDFPGMVATLNANNAADSHESVMTLESMVHSYAHLVNCDLAQDLMIVEVEGEMVGYVRVEWWRNDAGERIYAPNVFLKPEWRRRRIGTAMLRWAQGRLREIATGHPQDGPRYFDSFIPDTAPGAEALLRGDGYQPVRHGFLMVRPDLEHIPDFPLPPGLELRPVTPEHYRAIWEADVEAFRDHWGFTPPTEEDYERWQGDKVIFTPGLWKIAWDVEKNQVAGQVKSFINHEENAQFNRKRGWTEFISTRRPYRRLGLARALIVLSLHELKRHGMTEAALGVDTQNLSGALRVYEACGFRPVKRNTLYRKPLD